MRYALATWEVRDLLLIPSFMFSESAVIKRLVAPKRNEGGKPLAATARRAGWVGCNIALNRVPVEARIFLVQTTGCVLRNAAVPAAGSSCVPPRERTRSETPREPAGVDACATDTVIVSPEEVREKFKRVKPLKDISVTQRGESNTPKAFGAGCVEHRAAHRVGGASSARPKLREDGASYNSLR